MTRPVITLDRERELIEKVTRVVAQHGQQKSEIHRRHEERVTAVRAEHDRQRAAAAAAFQAAHAKLIRQYKEQRDAQYSEYESQGESLFREEQQRVESATLQHAERLEVAKTLWQHRCREIETAFKEQEVAPKLEYLRFKQAGKRRAADIQSLWLRAQEIARGRCTWPGEPAAAEVPAALPSQEYRERSEAAIASAIDRMAALEREPLTRFLRDGWPILIFLFSGLLAAYPAWRLLAGYGWEWAAAASVTFAMLAAVGTRFVVAPIARRRAERIVPEFQQAIALARGNLAAAINAAKAESRRSHREIVEQRDTDVAYAHAQWDQATEQQTAAYRTNLQQAEADFAARRNALAQHYEAALDEIEIAYPRQIDDCERGFERQILEMELVFRRTVSTNQLAFQQESAALEEQRKAALREFEDATTEMTNYLAARFPHWSVLDPAEHLARLTASEGDAGKTLSALRFGGFEFDLPAIAGGESAPPTLLSPAKAFQLPAVLSFPECPSLLLYAEGDGRAAAAEAMQNVMLRLLTSFPPGKVRFTIIDPVGLGQNFSAFMHLADYDERLVSSRIWTEAAHIQQRLTDLTEHMENVIQKYLRNEYSSIQEYNEQAGEVAEPYHILVIANFPANFSDEAARRLVSIASSGARCGVYTLISVDARLKQPRNFDLADLEARAATLRWDAAACSFRWKHPALQPMKLTLETPPDDERFTEIVRAVGERAKEATRIEVPFEAVAPAWGHRWRGDSRSEIEVPLGRAGAKKLQALRLGKGTSQHVLIAGKTGSGKSTLLNALITNAALHYSPTELQFYLIDFKKGVEFKAYAVHRLPHAQVIAIESEREFGLSVLERLDLELRRRGDLFRHAGAQDLKGYRSAQAKVVVPRILLVIDEFQEFFTSDDKISHDAALLLDRLVRQGRAFGIHVLLGSQTLAGAYSLARSTIGQMAVRIALQCSEADSHLILSEDNTAARLLSRPGEAIYNDANGLIEGNHPFQVVWLSDQQREASLLELRALAAEQLPDLPPPTVFEGNVAADPADNLLLRKALEQPPAIEPPAPRAWLGAAVAIKDPTSIEFRRQAGCNLLVVGQQEELALGTLSASVLALAGQMTAREDATPGSSLRRFYVLDGTRADSPEAGFWQNLSDRTALDAEVATPRDAARIVGEVAREVERRLASGDHAGEPIFLLIYNLARFRDLKKTDDFSLGSFDDAAPAADKQLAMILREGPALGVHTLAWCDAYSNVSRWLDRAALRDIDRRVLFQMSATDSSNLMDSAAASRLGIHLAISYSEEQGEAEKFRPYGRPSKEWLVWSGERLAARNATLLR